MREVVNYLKDLNYSKSNYEGVRVHYGSDLRAISVKPQYSINLTPGQITIFTKKKSQRYIKNEINLTQPAEVMNKTPHRVFIKLQNSILSDKKIGDLIYFINPGEDPND